MLSNGSPISQNFRVHGASPEGLPPYDLDVERSVLGGIILNPAMIPLVASIVEPDDFFRASHVVLCRAVFDMHRQGAPIEGMSVALELQRLGVFQDVGGHPWLGEILQKGGSGALVDHYAQPIREHAQARRLIEVGEEYMRALRAGLKTAAEIALEFGSRIQAIASGSQDLDGVTDRWPRPDPLIYHGIVGDIVHLAQPHTEADPVAILVQFLTAFGNLVGRAPHFAVGATTHHLNLFTALVGPTASGRKGTSWDIARWILGGLDDQSWSDCIKGGLTSGEGLIYHVRDDEETPLDRRLMVIETEFSRVLKAASREQNTLSDVIRQAWDTGNLRTLSKNQPLKATGAHVSLVGHITQADLRRHMSETDSLNGFANRFLWVMVRRSQFLPDGDSLFDVDWRGVHIHLARVLPLARECGRLTRDPDARALWHLHYRRLAEGKVGILGAILSRAEAQVMRIACIYALLDGVACIGADHLLAALSLWDYCEASARLAFDALRGDAASEKLLAALKESPQGLSRWHIHAEVFSGHKRREEIEALLSDLLSQGLIRRDRCPTRGRPIEVWRLAQCVESVVSAESPPEGPRP